MEPSPFFDLESFGLVDALLADGERDRARVTLRLPPEERPKPGSRLRVAIAQHTVRLFDPATGLAIRPR